MDAKSIDDTTLFPWHEEKESKHETQHGDREKVSVVSRSVRVDVKGLSKQSYFVTTQVVKLRSNIQSKVKEGNQVIDVGRQL